MTILFDLGGVFTVPLKEIDLFNYIDGEVSFEEFSNYWQKNKIVLDAHQGMVTDKYHIECLLEFCGSKVSTDDFYIMYSQMTNGLYKKTEEIISKLQANGIKTGILSNLREMDYLRHKEEIDFNSFDYIFFSYKMKLLKPNPNIYNEVIKVCNCLPSEIYFFDDRIENVTAAKSVGINAYQVTGENIDVVFKELCLV